MTRIYVMKPGSRVTARSGQLVVQKEEAIKGTWPLDQVTGIHCFGPMHLTGHGMHALLDARIEVHLYATSGRYRGSISGGDGSQLFVQMAHFDRWRDPAFRLLIARGLVGAKIRHQRAFLRYAAQRHTETEVREAEQSMARVLEGLERAADVEAVMGHEGYAARLYFSAFGALLKEGLPFQGRSRQPPRDPPNALLSLGYTLLATELGGQLEAAGLHPRLGFLHGYRYGRASLAQDLLEELRAPVIDRWVVGLFNKRRIRADQFETREDGGVYLVPETFKAFLHLYQQHLGSWEDDGSWRGRMTRRVQALVDAVLDGTPLEPPQWEDTW